jgi:hypothetical protein
MVPRAKESMVATTYGTVELAIRAPCADGVVRHGSHGELDPGLGCRLSRVTVPGYHRVKVGR